MLAPLRNIRSLSCGLLLCVCLLAFSSCATASGGILGGNGEWQGSDLAGRHIRTLAVNPTHLNQLVAGNEHGQIFISADAGLHWKEQALASAPITLSILIYHPSGDPLYALTNQGIMRSTDNGAHWDLWPTAPRGSVTALSFSPNDPKQMIVATMQQGIFTSQDAGETWSAENSGLPAGMTISGLTYDPGGNQVWAATSQGVYRLDRVQRTWTALNTGLPTGLAINCVQLASSQQGLIYAGAQRGFYRSTDAGQHWVSSKDSLAGTSVWSLLESDTVSLYAGTNVGVLQSRDGGETWSGFAHGLPMKEPVYALASGADANNQLFAAANNVYRYPGTSGDLTLSRLLPILLIVGFFVLLSLLIGRKRRRPVQLKKAPDKVE